METALLGLNETPYSPLPAVLQILHAELADINRYPDPAALALRCRIADQFGVTSSEVVVGAGSLDVLRQVIAAICSPGDEVIFAWPSFEAYPDLCRRALATACPVRLLSDERHDLEAMALAVTQSTRIVLLCSPNNPTSVYITGAEFEAFVQRIPARVWIVIDEAYMEYVRAEDSADSIGIYKMYPNICVMRTFSKAYGLAGLRVGYGTLPAALATRISEGAISYAVTNLAQKAAIVSLGAQPELRQRVDSIVRERSRVLASARVYGWTVPSSQANFIWIRLTGERLRALGHAFRADNIKVRTIGNHGIRITVGDPGANDRVLAVLKAQATAILNVES